MAFRWRVGQPRFKCLETRDRAKPHNCTEVSTEFSLPRACKMLECAHCAAAARNSSTRERLPCSRARRPCRRTSPTRGCAVLLSPLRTYINSLFLNPKKQRPRYEIHPLFLHYCNCPQKDHLVQERRRRKRQKEAPTPSHPRMLGSLG